MIDRGAPVHNLMCMYGVRMGTAPIGSKVVLNYDLTPAEWASGSVTMRFLVENYPMIAKAL